MATEPQAGTVSTAQAMALLLMEHPDELKKLQRDGFIKPIGSDSWRLVDLVQGFARAARKPDAVAPVSSAALAAHLSCVPSYIRKLVEQGVIERRSDGRFDQDQCRAKYIAHLRAERARSPKSAAGTEFIAAKTALIKMRVEEKQQTLVRQSDVDELIDSMMGVILPALASLPVRCAPRGDLATRRNIERVVFEVRREMASVALRKAEEAGEPGNGFDAAETRA